MGSYVWTKDRLPFEINAFCENEYPLKLFHYCKVLESDKCVSYKKLGDKMEVITVDVDFHQ